MVGEGGQPLQTFLELDDLWLLKGIIDGIARRYHAQWESARLIVSPHTKNARDIEFPWEREPDMRTSEQCEADSQRALEAARAAFNLED